MPRLLIPTSQLYGVVYRQQNTVMSGMTSLNEMSVEVGGRHILVSSSAFFVCVDELISCIDDIREVEFSEIHDNPAASGVRFAATTGSLS